MTPQLMQAIKLLQLSNLDLATYVEAELERNPLLERAATRRRRAGERDAADAEAAADDRHAATAATPSRATGSARSSRPAARPSRTSSIPAWKTCFPTPTAGARPTATPSRRPIRNGPASAPAGATTATTISKPSCRRRRRWPTTSPTSCALAITDPAERLIGRHLIDLGRRGRLSRRRPRGASPTSSARRSPTVEAVLDVLQTFDPAGVVRAQPRRMPGDPAARSATASIPPCRRWSPISTCWPSARLAALEAALRRRRARISPT